MEGLQDLRSALSESLPGFQEMENVVVYITGSFGRLEASYPGSDLDIFLLTSPASRIPRRNSRVLSGSNSLQR